MEPVSTRLTEEEIEQIEQARQGGEKRSAAIRRLLRDALDEDGEKGATVTSTTLLAVFGAILLGIAMEPVASTEFLVAVAGLAFGAAALLERMDR